MKKLLSSFLGLMLCGCGADPTIVANASSYTGTLEQPPQTSSNPEAPQETIAKLQLCADRYARRLSSESYAIQFDIEATKSGKVTTVKVKDSKLDGHDVEACLANALKNMNVAAEATNPRVGVSPQSHSMVGFVQAAAPIAMIPIVLVAAGVTILVGVTIYVTSEAIDAAKESSRCRAVKERCIDHCSGPAGLPAPGGGRFRGCMRECMESQGCSY